MKLYIWVDPYKVSYGSSLLVAVASSTKEAKEQAMKGRAYEYGKYEHGIGRVELGEPDRVLDLPCAEWHEFHE